MNLPELTSHTKAFVKQQNSPNTRQAYVLDLSKWLYFLGDQAPTVDLAIAFKEWLEGKYSANTARRVYSTVRTFYDWLRKQGIITINPFEVVKGPRALTDRSPHVPTDVQVERILRSVERWDQGPGTRHYLILTLLLNGLRAQEVCDLRVRDHFYDAATRSWVLRVTGKGMKERVVPLTKEAQDALHFYLDTRYHASDLAPRRQENAPLITDPVGNVPITRKQVAYVVDKYAKHAGIGGISPHSFRHHYGTRLYRATRDIVSVGKLLGHTKPETTAIYARMDLSDLVEAARMDPRNPVDKGVYDAKQRTA